MTDEVLNRLKKILDKYQISQYHNLTGEYLFDELDIFYCDQINAAENRLWNWLDENKLLPDGSPGLREAYDMQQLARQLESEINN